MPKLLSPQHGLVFAARFRDQPVIIDQHVDKTVDIIRAESSADPEIGERRIGEHEPMAGAALEFRRDFPQRRAPELDPRVLPAENPRLFFLTDCGDAYLLSACSGIEDDDGALARDYQGLFDAG